MFIKDSNATSTGIGIPLWNGMTAVEAFHYHPSGDTSISGGDKDMVAKFLSYGITALTVVSATTSQTHSLFNWFY